MTLVFQDTLNSRRLTVGPDGAGKSYDSFWFTDQGNGGDSQVTPGHRSLSWTCNSEDSVLPFYQPKLDLRTGARIGFEAFLRWRERDAELQLPNRLAEAFKDYELATNIGDIMQRQVAQDVKA